MEDIKIYSPKDLKIKDGVVSSKINSSIWNLRFYEAGSFQFNLKKNVFSIDDIVRQGDKCGIVLKIVEDYNQVVVYGYTLDAITKFRHIYQPQRFTGTPEDIICNVAELTLANSGERQIPTLVVKRNQTTETGEHTLNFDNNNVYEKLLGFTKSTEISYVVEFEGEGLVFRCCKGRDMTEYLKFGRRYRNVDSMEYTQDNYNSVNVVYSQYEEYDWNSTEEAYITKYGQVGNASGFLRRETGHTVWDEAQTIIKNNQLSQSLKGIANGKLIYKKDWLLGDYVTASFDDLITEKQIVEVQEVYEKSNTIIIPIFGEEKANSIRKLMQGG